MVGSMRYLASREEKECKLMEDAIGEVFLKKKLFLFCLICILALQISHPPFSHTGEKRIRKRN